MNDAFHDDGPPISRLHAAVKALDAFVHSVVPPPPPTACPSSSSSEPTPVQRFGRQDVAASRWKELAKAHVAVCGLGGIGALAADALARMGVGRLLLVDGQAAPLDWSGLGHMGYDAQDVGMSRLQALRLKLQSVRTPVAVDTFALDWADDGDLVELRKKLSSSTVAPPRPSAEERRGGGEEGSGEEEERTGDGLGLFEALTQRRPYDLVLSCVEDDGARRALNQLCLTLSLPLLHASLSPCNTAVQLRTVLPGHTSCLECRESATTLDQVAASIARAFPASLPHVDMLAAGLLTQHAVKFLLELGDFVPLRTVNVATFELESFAFPPNSACVNAACRARQEEESSAAARYH